MLIPFTHVLIGGLSFFIVICTMALFAQESSIKELRQIMSEALSRDLELIAQLRNDKQACLNNIYLMQESLNALLKLHENTSNFTPDLAQEIMKEAAHSLQMGRDLYEEQIKYKPIQKI